MMQSQEISMIEQITAELEEMYDSPDPWSYEDNFWDYKRVAEMKIATQSLKPINVLDIGCGNGFMTQHLPGDRIVGIDISRKAIDYASNRGIPNAVFLCGSIQNAVSLCVGEKFDLICITGVLYDKWVGTDYGKIISIIRQLSAPVSTLLTCHIAEWYKIIMPFDLLYEKKYRYRDHTHLLNIHRIK